ncbi:Glycosyltransferase involved in cell wall bisynthesis [Paenibacillus sp. cl141a]|uniref:glycosyltransferase family 2 protein n=1 Tax=Paenibacillus sp. cl141a TaxID=1761877 RepID=UPI0008BF4367|nr:glycosyltransferase family 2 protein [Paenibacillus sp. cl141a]SEL32499.1 Glycosyltransferase involved in cell wall bisynthesis [Paenibacillus sp. cl141a]
MKLPLSLCMIVNNEQKFIKDCLDSVKEFVSEIVIGDTGSTDMTESIAREYGAEVFRVNWKNDFGDARNAVLERASMPYVLVMDADERLNQSSSDQLIKFFEYETTNPGKVVIKNMVRDNDITFGQATRIFPNLPDYRYTGRVHEQLQYQGRTPKSLQTNIIIDHLGYKDGIVTERNKIQRNLSILTEIEKSSPHDLYVIYQIGKTHFVAKNYPEAVKYLEKVIKSIPSNSLTSSTFASSAWLTLCYSLYYMKSFKLLNKYIEEGIEFFNDYTDLYFIYGLSLTSMNHPDAIKMVPLVFNYCLQLGEADSTKYETTMGVGSYKAHYNLGIYWEIIGEIDKAYSHYLFAVQQGYQNAAVRLKLLSK